MKIPDKSSFGCRLHRELGLHLQARPGGPTHTTRTSLRIELILAVVSKSYRTAGLDLQCVAFGYKNKNAEDGEDATCSVPVQFLTVPKNYSEDICAA